MTLATSNPAGAVVVDASVAIAIAAQEVGREPIATSELHRYSALSYVWYAPGVLVSETLYVLCLKHQAGLLTAVEYAQAASNLEALQNSILPPPDGEVSLVLRAHAIGTGYSCRRSGSRRYGMGHDYVQDRAEVRFLRGRVKFQGIENSAPFPSDIVVFRPISDLIVIATVKVACSVRQIILITTPHSLNVIAVGKKDHHV